MLQCKHMNEMVHICTHSTDEDSHSLHWHKTLLASQQNEMNRFETEMENNFILLAGSTGSVTFSIGSWDRTFACVEHAVHNCSINNNNVRIQPRQLLAERMRCEFVMCCCHHRWIERPCWRNQDAICTVQCLIRYAWWLFDTFAQPNFEGFNLIGTHK